jgi:hypothetical protein
MRHNIFDYKYLSSIISANNAKANIGANNVNLLARYCQFTHVRTLTESLNLEALKFYQEQSNL